MDFIGTGRRLQQNDIGDAARAINIPTAALLAFNEVESSGKGFDNQNRPKMLFEPHKFWANLGAGAKRTKAAAQGLAYAVWGTVKYPSDSYPRLEKAVAIDLPMGLRSASYGLSQILGDKYSICGFINEESFVNAMKQGEREQLLATVTLMRSWGMDKMLQNKDLTKSDSWRPACSKWNGSRYEKNNYHVKCANAFIKHNTPDNKTIPTSSVIIYENGMKGEAILNIQKDLASLGYIFNKGIDGRFGDETEANVRLFQNKMNITTDGKVGPNTSKILAQEVANNKIDMSPSPPVWKDQTNNKNPILIWIIGIVIITIGIGLKVFNII